MKAMILAAGRGERLRPLTDTLPKPLVQVQGKALIEYHIEKLVKLGITDLIINCAWLAETLMTTLGDGSRYGATIQYSYEKEALETGGGIKAALPLLGDEPFLVINGDVFIDYLPVLPILDANTMAHIWLVDNPEHNPNGDFGLEINQNTQEQLVTQHSAEKYTFSGIGIYRPALFKEQTEARFGLGNVLRLAMEQKMVTGNHFAGYWCDVGTMARLAQLEKRQSV